MTLRSLHIGINDYPGTDSDLHGCVNDAQDWSDQLAARGAITFRLFDSGATYEGITSEIERVLGGATAGDTVVITYSGHGTWMPDTNGDEVDGRDEALVPHDIMNSGPILDDDLFVLLSGRPTDAGVVFISDSCHSGTVARLMAPLNPRGTKTHRRARFLPPSVFLGGRDLRQAAAAQAAPTTGRSRNAGLLIAGCRDAEFSYDAYFGRRPNGAFTRVAIDALAGLSGRATYNTWFAAIRKALPAEDYPQTPQMSGYPEQMARRVLS